jgi:iron uptake system component EfeO
MQRKAALPALLVPVLLGLVLLAAGCGSGDDPSGPGTLSFKLTDEGCDPMDAEAPAGPITFEVEGASSYVTELEVIEDESIIGEKENLTEGLTGSFTLNLKPGKYTLRCTLGDGEDGTLTVTGAPGGGGEAKADPAAEAAVERYREYLEKNTTKLVAATASFVTAVEDGDTEKAMALYAPARVPYERIEPVAVSFGDLDPRIDARENDVPKGEWGGFHRIEKALWKEGTTKGMKPVAMQLLEDVTELQKKMKTVDLEAAQIANGANELLGEVSASKITGEEERYSHTDLVDFEANVEGAEAAFVAVEPLLSAKNPKLAKEIEAQFKKVYASLQPYRDGAGFVPYTELNRSDTRRLAQEIDALAELLSQVPAEIVG